MGVVKSQFISSISPSHRDCGYVHTHWSSCQASTQTAFGNVEPSSQHTALRNCVSGWAYSLTELFCIQFVRGCVYLPGKDREIGRKHTSKRHGVIPQSLLPHFSTMLGFGAHIHIDVPSMLSSHWERTVRVVTWDMALLTTRPRAQPNLLKFFKSYMGNMKKYDLTFF